MRPGLWLIAHTKVFWRTLSPLVLFVIPFLCVFGPLRRDWQCRWRLRHSLYHFLAADPGDAFFRFYRMKLIAKSGAASIRWGPAALSLDPPASLQAVSHFPLIRPDRLPPIVHSNLVGPYSSLRRPVLLVVPFFFFLCTVSTLVAMTRS